ncbi:MAG: TonB-dependent receptor [candidate division Zixibacteria bacterium]|nr:TonB-dependent receptor [candidate division Zixibacteria bacterium]
MDFRFSPKAGIFFRLGKTLGLAAVLIFGWSAASRAESNLKISGQLVDSLSGRPVGGAAVEVVETGAKTTTDPQGGFFFYDLPTGTYQLKVEAPSYTNRTHSVKVFADGETRLEIQLSALIVSGPPVIVTADSLTASASQPSLVFDRIELEKSKHLSLAQLLSRSAGMELKASGVYGSTEQITIRGGAANQVLVLLDGRPLNSNLRGEADLSFVSADALERIEVYKGAQTARFGPDALAGAVLLFSKKPEGASRFAPKLRSEIGGLGHRSIGGEVNIPLLEETQTKVFYQNSSAKGNFDYTYKNQEYERKGGYNWTNRASANLRRRNLETSFFWAKARRGLPGDVLHLTPRSSERDERFGLSLSFKPVWKSGWFLEPVASWEKLTQRFKVPDSFAINYDNRYQSAKKKLEAKMGRKTSGALLQVSADYTESSLEGIDYLRPARGLGKTVRRSGGAGLLADRQLSLPFYFTLGASGAVRSDWTDFTSPAYSPLFSGSLHWNKTVKARLFGSWGESFRLPTLDALFWKEDVFAAGNPNLLPEKAQSREAGYRLTFPVLGRVNWEQTFFHNDLKNLIVWQRNFEGKFTPQNVSKAKTFGREEKVSWQLPKILELEANHTQTEPINESDFILHQGKQLVFRPRHIHNARISASYGIAALNLTGRWVGKRFTRAENTKHLPPYETYDARFSLSPKIGKLDCSFSFAVENFTGRRYEILELFPMPGRALRLGVEAKW